MDNNVMVWDETNSFIPIVYVSHGIANRFSNRIEINEDLKKYPELLKPILAHELQHSDMKFSLKDLSLDVGVPNLNLWKLFKFMVTHPKSFTQVFPFYIYQNKFIYDINKIIVYSILLCIISIAIYVGFKV